MEDGPCTKLLGRGPYRNLWSGGHVQNDSAVKKSLYLGCENLAAASDGNMAAGPPGIGKADGVVGAYPYHPQT